MSLHAPDRHSVIGSSRGPKDGGSPVRFRGSPTRMEIAPALAFFECGVEG